MDANEDVGQSTKFRSLVRSSWWQPSVEDYYSPFDPHFDSFECDDEVDEEELERRIVASKGAFACLSAEILLRVSGFLDLESLCRGALQLSHSPPSDCLVLVATNVT